MFLILYIFCSSNKRAGRLHTIVFAWLTAKFLSSYCDQNLPDQIFFGVNLNLYGVGKVCHLSCQCLDSDLSPPLIQTYKYMYIV